MSLTSVERLMSFAIAAVIALNAYSACAQECTVTTPYTAMTIGPLSISAVSSPAYQVTAEQQVGNQTYCTFKWSGKSATARLKGGLTGDITNLSVQGTKNLLVGGHPAAFSIPVNSLSFDLSLARALTISLLGGHVTLPAHTNLHISNVKELGTHGSSAQGVLGFSLDQIRLVAAQVDLPYGLPAITTDLRSEAAVTFEEDLAALFPHVSIGNFSAIVGNRYAGREFTLHAAKYAGSLRGLEIHAIAIRVDASNTVVTLSNVSSSATLVVAPNAKLRLPFYATGAISASAVSSRIPRADGPAILPSLQLSGFRFKASPVPAQTFHTADELAVSSSLGISTIEGYIATAIKAGSDKLAEHPKFNFFAFLPRSELIDTFRPLLTRFGLTDVSNISFGNQVITANVRYNSLGALNEPQDLLINVVPYIDKDGKLMLQLHIESVRLQDVVSHSSVSSDTLIETAGATVSPPDGLTIDMERPVALDSQLVKNVDLSTTGGQGSEHYTITAKPFNVLFSLSDSVVLTEPTGIRLLTVLVDK